MAQYQGSNPQFSVSLYQFLLHYNNASPYLLDLDRKWSQAWAFVNQLTNGKSMPTNSPDGTYLRPIARRTSVSQPISIQGAQSGQNLILTWQDPTYTGFRVKDTLVDTAMNQGRVISVAPGTVTIEPVFNPTTLTAGTHFLTGTTCYITYDTSGNFNSAGKTNLYRTNDIQTDYTMVSRDSCQMARREKISTLVGKDGELYTYSQQEQDMVRRMFKLYGKKFLLGEVGTKNSQIEGVINGTRGLRAATMQDGTYANTGAPLDVTTFEALINQVASATGMIDQELTLIPGRKAMARISGFYNNQLNYTGSTVKMGGRPVVNLDVREITVAGGIKCNLMPLAMLNDNLELPAWFTDSLYIINTSPIPAMGGKLGTESPIQKIHFSSYPGETKDDRIYKVITGMTAPGSGNSMGAPSLEGYELTSNTIDGYSAEIEEDNGFSMIADDWALFEYQY